MPAAPSSYGLNITMEYAVVRQLLADPTVMPRLADHLRADGFEDPAARDLVAGALSYYRTAKETPTRVGVLQEIREGSKAGRYKVERVQAAEDALGHALTLDPVASSYVVERILGEERKRAIWSALERSIKLYQGGRHDDVEAEIERAALVGRSDATLGIDYGGSLKERTERRLKYKAPPRWGTGIRDLDDLIDGGLSKDNPLGIVLGGPKFGKSLFLDHVAMHHMVMGGFAVFFSLEMGEGEVVTRHDAAISRTPIKMVHERAAEVDEKVEQFLDRCNGGLHVKKFPGGGVTSCKHLDAYLEMLRITKGIKPTVIISDYADEMAANDSSKYDRRHEELAAITGELRNLGEKHGSVIWTASQIKADALEKKTPSIGDIAGAFAKAAIADLIVAICRTPEERVEERVRFFVAASRFCADGVITGSLPSAYSMGKIVVESMEG